MNTLCILPNGKIQGLYTELIDLSLLGELYIERISTIEFDNSTQRWCVRSLSGESLFSDVSRAACLQWEQEHWKA